MKKNRILAILMPLLLLSLSSCVLYNGKGKPGGGGNDPDPTPTPTPDPDPDPDPTPPTPTGEVTTYLVLGENGLYKGERGQDVPTKFLENTISFKADIGAALPGVEDVTSTIEGSVFQYWQAYDGTGAPIGYTHVPSVNEKILYAVFTGGEGGKISEKPTDGYGLMFGNGKYTINNVNFEKDDTFGLYDFATEAQWVVDLDPHSFGGDPSNIKWTSYLSKGANAYTVLKSFTASYFCIKLAYEHDQVYIGIPAEPEA